MLIIEGIALFVFNKIYGYALPDEDEIMVMNGYLGVSLINVYLFFAYEKAMQ